MCGAGRVRFLNQATRHPHRATASVYFGEVLSVPARCENQRKSCGPRAARRPTSDWFTCSKNSPATSGMYKHIEMIERRFLPARIDALSLDPQKSEKG
jgi:hypothetical protein